MDLTIAVALGAGLLSFLSPCVLPLVPAYLGQLSAVAVVGRADGTVSRWLAVRHAIAYVVGFGAVFTLLGVTATYLAGPLVDYLPLLRQVGGILLIVLGLNLAGVLRLPALDRTSPWLPPPARSRWARLGPARERDSPIGSVAGSSGPVVAGWHHSGLARSSRSAGPRVSA
jgi:cytochrome c-type biogenesis protein